MALLRMHNAAYRPQPKRTVAGGSGLPMPHGRTLAPGILPSARSMPAALSASCLRRPIRFADRCPANAGFRGTGSPSRIPLLATRALT